MDADGSLRIPLGRGRHALCSPEAGPRVEGHRYYLAHDRRGRPYAYRKDGGRQVRLVVDAVGAPVRPRYRNGNLLDCRPENLRLPGGSVSHSPSHRRQPYCLNASVDGRVYHVGRWPTREWAVRAQREVRRAAQGLRGRGLGAARVRRELRRAAGLEV